MNPTKEQYFAADNIGAIAIKSTVIDQSYHFLRSKSYALDHGPYSVDQLVEMGWLKIKKRK